MPSRLFSRLLPLLLAALLLATAAAPALGRGLTAQDLVTLKRLSDPQPSPDGSTVAYVLRETDLEADKGRTDIWLLDIASGESRRLTTDPAGDSSPRWADDGTLFFLSSRSESSQVWAFDAAALEATDATPRQVTDLPLDVSNLVVGPAARSKPGPADAGARHLAFTADVYLDCESMECTAARLQRFEESPATARVYDRLFMRHWDHWKDGRRSHLFVMDLGEADGEPVDVTRGFDADVPSKPFGGAEEIAFSPDGRHLVFSARDAGREEPWSTDFDLYRVPVTGATDGDAAPEALTENPAWDTHPVFSPDGSTLAYFAMERPGYESDRFGLMLRAWPDGDPRPLASGWDRSISSIAWSPDGRTIYATAQDRGNHRLVAIDVGTGRVREMVSRGHVRSPAVAGDLLVFGLDTLDRPVDLYALPLGEGRAEPRRLTDVNREALAGIEMGRYEQFTFAGWNDETVMGYLVEPVGREPGQKAPVAFLIHGGPQGSFDNDFHYRWNPQVYAAAGYAAVMIDFHGSTGYGQAFTDSIAGDWGGKPLEDLQKGWATVLSRYRWLDGDRACALGASYGGYMINWIAGHWSDAFSCLVNHDGLFDMRSMYYSTEELWFPEWEMGGPEYERREEYTKWSPSQAVENWKTPMLVVHGELDYRVPITEGIATFTALQRRNIPSRFLYFPDENHWVLKPTNSMVWHDVVLGWLDQWTSNGDSDPSGSSAGDQPAVELRIEPAGDRQ